MTTPHRRPDSTKRPNLGSCTGVIGGVERNGQGFILDLPHSDSCFVNAYPMKTTWAILDCHISAFVLLGGVARSIL